MHRNELLAASRHGVIKVASLAELGITRRTAHRRCAPGGPWQKVLPGVVLLGDMPPTRRQLVEAALLCAGSSAMISGLEACQRFGFRNVPADPRAAERFPLLWHHHVNPGSTALTRYARCSPRLSSVTGRRPHSCSRSWTQVANGAARCRARC